MKKQSTIYLILIVIILLYVLISNNFSKLKQYFIYGIETFKEKMDSRDSNESIKVNIPIMNGVDDKNNSDHPGYCFIGENDGTRHCVELQQDDKCVSGQVYKHKEICINPDLRY